MAVKGLARKFAEEVVSSGTVAAIRNEAGECTTACSGHYWTIWWIWSRDSVCLREKEYE